MSQKTRQTSKKSKADQIETVVRLLNAGKTQAEAAKTLGVNIRTIQRWVAGSEVRQRLSATQKEIKTIIETDPVVLSVTEIRQQVNEIVQYRESQLTFALEMGRIIQKTSAVLLKAVERLEANPDELSARSIPPLMRALTDATEKVSNAWARATGLDDLLESMKDEPEVISQRAAEN